MRASIAQPRSIFPNYKDTSEDRVEPLSNRSSPENGRSTRSLVGKAGIHRQTEMAMARSFVYRFLATAFEGPEIESWNWLTTRDTLDALMSAATILDSGGLSLAGEARLIVGEIQHSQFEAFSTAHIAAFGHAARGECPLNEIEYGDIKADPLFQPHRLADLAAFYRAFGLELTEDADERQDHICIELEFMAVLAAKESYSHRYQFPQEKLELCLDAQKQFQREHLARWTPAFTRRLSRFTTDKLLAALAQFTRAVIELECRRFQIVPGSEDLLLRPADPAAETLCDSCGFNSKLPGAALAPLATA